MLAVAQSRASDEEAKTSCGDCEPAQGSRLAVEEKAWTRAQAAKLALGRLFAAVERRAKVGHLRG